ncbi:Chromosome transmission fidelity protein 8 [Nakaseomyces glabratus]|nr:Chromosome transmission fidelity protein 8 [Nakaseomyces glabratus]KTB15703.1 Chromosome transmission fidelity protein 8 [Nakaseomyces glabratus]
MPSVDINYDKLKELLAKDSSTDGGSATPANTIETPLGTIMVEIQGSLELPTSIDEDSELSKKFDGVDAVKFGSLNIEDKKAVLYVGKKQRLLGKVVKLSTPLGILKFNEGKNVEMLDIIEYKVIFSDRPLPIM